MMNIMDYLDWRGDLSFVSVPLCEVDSFIFSQFVSADFSGFIPEEGAVSLAACVSALQTQYSGEKLGLLISQQVMPLLLRAAETVRFRDVQLSGYVNHVDEEDGKQFSAMTIALGDGARFIVFSGTDDTLVAWKEDFMLSVQESVPAQRDALAYLLEAAKEPGAMYVGGHSKGGNLAVYAAMNAPYPVQERIVTVFNFDGPGFRESPLERPEYRRLRERIHTVVPQHTIVGTLLWNETNLEIVHSHRSGIQAHDGFNWEVCGPRFVRREKLAATSEAFARAMDEMVSGMDDEDRLEAINELFSALESTGAKTLTELTDQKIGQAMGVVQKIGKSAPIRAFVTKLLTLMLRQLIRKSRDEQ